MSMLMRIDEVLKSKGMSVNELSQKIGMSYVYTLDIVNNKKFLRCDKLLLISNALDVDVKDLFHDTKSVTPHQMIERLERQLSDLKNSMFLSC